MAPPPTSIPAPIGRRLPPAAGAPALAAGAVPALAPDEPAPMPIPAPIGRRLPPAGGAAAPGAGAAPALAPDEPEPMPMPAPIGRRLPPAGGAALSAAGAGPGGRFVALPGAAGLPAAGPTGGTGGGPGDLGVAVVRAAGVESEPHPPVSNKAKTAPTIPVARAAATHVFIAHPLISTGFQISFQTRSGYHYPGNA